MDEDELPADQRVRVGVRIRPFNQADQGHTEKAVCANGTTVSVEKGCKTKNFTFDYVFQCEQDELFDSIGRQMLLDAWDGYNATTFAYGQTGSGKTHSMMGVLGNPHLEGLLPRIVRQVFAKQEELACHEPGLSVKIQMSYIEIYNERVHDLLQAGRPPPSEVQSGKQPLEDLELRQDKKGNFFVKNLSMHSVSSADKVFTKIDDGNNFRQKHATDMNEFSSRSHALICIYIKQVHSEGGRDKSSKITIVDLAGSERQNKTNNEDAARLKEAENINRSLLTLVRCLQSASDSKSQHTPVRDSALTRLLSEVFGGNSKAIMLACVSPSLYNVEETLSTLQYAWSAKKIKHKAKVGYLGNQPEIHELKAQVQQLGKTLIAELEKAAKEKQAIMHDLKEAQRERDEARHAAQGAHSNEHLVHELRREIEEMRRENEALREEVRRLNSLPPPAHHSPQPSPHSRHSYDSDDGLVDKGHDELCGGHEDPFHGADSHHQMPPGMMGAMDSARQDQTARPGSEVRSYRGHQAAVYCCDMSCRGDLFVSASRDQTLKVWELRSGSVIATLKGHNGCVLSCAFAPNGTDIVSSSEDKTIKIWDSTCAKKVLTMKGHTERVYGVAYSPSGQQIVSASGDHTARVWSSQKGDKISVLKGHTSAVFAARFSNNGRMVVTASDDKTLKVFDWQNGNVMQTLADHQGTVWSCCFSPADDCILSSSMDGTLKMWNTASGQMLRTYKGHSAPVHHAIFVKNGEVILSASRDRTVKVWETSTGRVRSTLIGHTNTVYHVAAFNNLILTCSSDQLLKVWHKENLQVAEDMAQTPTIMPSMSHRPMMPSMGVPNSAVSAVFGPSNGVPSSPGRYQQQPGMQMFPQQQQQQNHLPNLETTAGMPFSNLNNQGHMAQAC